MKLPNSDKVAKAAFGLSILVLAFLYGYAAHARNWFPGPLLQGAWAQAEVVAPSVTSLVSPPHWMKPRVYDRSGVRVVRPESVQPGLTLLAGWWSDFDGKQGLKLIDSQGRTLHEWRVEPDEMFPDPPDVHTRREPGWTGIHGAHLFPNGDALLTLDYVGTARLDACGEVLWRLPVGTHHSIERAADGTFWITGGTHEPPSAGPDADGYAGVDPTFYDRILHVSEDGEVLDEISILDVLYANGLERYMAKGSRYPPDDMKNDDLTHMNDVEALDASDAASYPLFEAGDLVVSLRNLDLVFVLDPESRRVSWHANLFIQQHDPDFIGDGWIGVFDNNVDGTDRGTMLGGSRILALQPHTDSVRVLFPTSDSEPFYTERMGKWQRLANGNLLLTEAQPARVVEVTPDGRTAWEWVAEADEDGMVAELSEGTRYDLTPEDVASWPCSPADSATN